MLAALPVRSAGKIFGLVRTDRTNGGHIQRVRPPQRGPSFSINREG
ncbi:MAG: hypothetical protein K0U49_01100 [Alphaproteobacteria bacterium]|nr:hypothetical protein [Alphaproteobacteria bacterium]MDA9225035.1 hypothetical protein [Tateyamaria sp.]